MGVRIATFSYFIETSPNRIACEFSGEWAHRCLLVVQWEPASQVCGCLEPASPLLARARVGLKPALPLRAGDVGKLKPSSPLRAGEVG